MIGFTPFDLPFMAGDSAIPGTHVFVFDFGGNFVVHQSRGEYLREEGVFQAEQSLYGLNSAGGTATPPAGVHNIGPFTESTRVFSSSFGLYFLVLNFASVSDSGGFSLGSNGLYDQQPNPLGLDPSGQILGSISSGTLNSYSQSHDLGGTVEFQPRMSQTLGSVGGQYFEVFFYASGRDPGMTVSYSAGGAYLEQEGVDTLISSRTELSNSGLYQPSVDVLGRDVQGVAELFSNGNYAEGTLNPFSRIQSTMTVSGSGQYSTGERETELNVTRFTEDDQIRSVE